MARLLVGLISALGLTTAATAQQEQQNDVETVVVTGSLMHRFDLESSSPVTLISKDEIVNSGLTSTSDVVRAISADNSGTLPTAFSGGFAAGASGVALRGLTVNSTLVLINSRRTTNYPLPDDGDRGFVDLNTIPFEAVDHIEVLKDGASSLYGTDAIAGVVNIILKSRFEGAIGDVETGASQHGGGGLHRFAGTMGYGDFDSDHANAFINVEYQRDDFIHVAQRGFPFNTQDLSSIGGLDLNSVSSIYGSVAPGYLTDPTDPTTGVQDEGSVQQILAPGGCGPKGKQTTDEQGNTYCEQNIAIYNDDQPKQERYGVYGRISARLNDAEAYIDGSYFENKLWATFAPQSIRQTLPHITSNIALPAYLLDGKRNPNDPFAVSCPATGVEGETPCQDALIHYIFGDIPVIWQFDNRVLRATAGLKGAWAGWGYDIGLVAAHAGLETKVGGYLNFTQLKQDILDGSYSFIDPSQNSGAVRSALAPTLAVTSTTDMDSADIRATRAILDLPGGSAQLGLGGEARHEAMNNPDLNPNLEILGLGPVHTFGNRNIYSAFAELDLPLAKALDVDISGRFDRYSDFGSAFNPKIGTTWQLAHAIRLRGTYSTGFRAPSFAENGSSTAEGFVPENPQVDFPDWSALHHNDQYTQTYGLGLAFITNRNLKPETSTNYTVGAVLQPFDDDSVTATIDYYHIAKQKTISPADPAPALTAAFNGTAIPPGYLVVFDVPDPNFPDAPLRPLEIGAPYINAASLVTDGIDIQINATFDVAAIVNWQTVMSYTHIFTFDFMPSADLPTQHWVGLQSPYILSSSGGTPQDRVSWANTFTWGDLSVTGTLYYTSGLKEATVDLTGDYNCDLYLPARKFCHMDAFWDFDLTSRYHITDQIDLFGSIRNLFDAKPPLDPIDYAGVNYNPTYAQQGIVGRFFTLGVAMRTDTL